MESKSSSSVSTEKDRAPNGPDLPKPHRFLCRLPIPIHKYARREDIQEGHAYDGVYMLQSTHCLGCNKIKYRREYQA